MKAFVKKEKKLTNLLYGDTFTLVNNPNIYMKISIEDNYAGKYKKIIHAVNIETGTLSYFSTETIVNTIKITAYIEELLS